MAEPDPTVVDPGNQGAFRDVPVVLSVSVGQARLPVRELLALDRNAIVPLDRRVDEPVILVAGDRVVAYGELQEMEGSEDGALAVRITSIAEDDPTD